MKTVVELALERPFELRMIQVSRVQVEVVSVNRDRRILEPDDDLYAVAFSPRTEVEQGMLIQAQLLQNTAETFVRLRHKRIVDDAP